MAALSLQGAIPGTDLGSNHSQICHGGRHAAWSCDRGRGGEYYNLRTMELGHGKEVKNGLLRERAIDGKTYCFGNEDAKTIFMKVPQGNLAKGASLLIRTSTSIEPGTPLVYEASALHATGIASNAASRRCRVSRVEVSARPSMRPWRKWR